MTAEDYNDLCNELYKKLYDTFENKNDEKLRFAPRGRVEEVLSDDVLRRFLRSLAPSSDSIEQDLGISEDEFVLRIKQRRLYDFLAVLVFATRRTATSRVFVKKLVAIPDWDKNTRESLSRLPRSREQLHSLFNDEVEEDRFYSNQACFCAVVLRKGEEIQIPEPSIQRLPYVEEEPLNKGSFGKVSRVVIAKGHFYDPSTRSHNSKKLEMARKDYEIESGSFPRAGQEERNVMDMILASGLQGSRSENIVYNLGSIAISRQTYSLFMPKAICDLRTYMVAHHDSRPATVRAKYEIIACADGLAAGLNFLHSEMRTPELEDMVCYHMDLKPNNVLVFQEGDRFVWKLSDFGMARVKVRHSRDNGKMPERDFTTWFKRRKHLDPDPSLSATLNRRGEGTYLAPESVSAKPSMTTKSDVWSLGCVLSVVFAYLEDGGRGVKEFSAARGDARNSDGYDRFFVKSGFGQIQINPEVRGWHKHLLQRAGQRSAAEGKAVKTFLKSLETEILEVNPDKRCSAKSVRETLRATYRSYKALETEDTDTPYIETAEIVHTPHGVQRLVSWFHPPSTKEQEIKSKVEPWYISSTEDFKGTEISPDGTLVAYWTDTKILLYTSQSLPASQGTPITDAQEYRLDNSENSVWKSVALTDKYLVASATGSTFNCRIFDLNDGPTEDAVLVNPVQVILGWVPEIQRIAISPNGRTICCVLRHKEDERERGSLFYADVADLLALAGDAVTTGLYDRQRLKPLVPLKWPGPDVVYLSISNRKDVHLVFRPELTTRSREHAIPIMHVSIQTATTDTLYIKSTGYDSSNSVGFFTSFIPSNVADSRHGDAPPAAPEAVVITREKLLHIRTFSNRNSASHDMQSDVNHYRIVKLLGCMGSDTIIGVGTLSANQKMVLIRIDVSRPEYGRSNGATVTELVSLPGLLYGDEFSARYVEPTKGNGERFVLISSLVGANRRRAIYKLNLAGMDMGEGD